MQLINYEASEIWEIFQKRKEYFRAHMEVIAENPEYDVVIYLSEEERGTNMFPNIVVYIDNNEEYSEVAVSQYDCEHTVKEIYAEFLDEERLINHMLERDEEDRELDEEQDMIETRETELYDAAADFLDILLNETLEHIVGYQEAEETREDLIDHICQYLYEEHGLSVYRPMILEDEDGEEFFEEFPYDCMIFED